MATVTGLTAARMLAIEDSSIVSGQIDVSGHLILTTHGGEEIDSGSVVEGNISYTHIQSVPLAVWNIIHPLNFTPNIITVDSAGTEFIGNVEVIDTNNLRITFSAPFSGSAYLS